ncbi:hypothetical protein N2152v2_002304 [Parachlorella kessleri]
MGQTVAKIAVGLPLIWYNGPSSHQAALKTLQDNGLTTDYNQVNAFLLQPQLSPVLNSVPFNIDSEKRTFVLRFDGFDPNNVDTSSDHWYDQIIGDYAGGDFYLGLYNKVQLDLKTLTLGLPCQPQAYTGSLLTVSLNVNGQGPGLHRIDYLLSYENCIGPQQFGLLIGASLFHLVSHVVRSLGRAKMGQAVSMVMVAQLVFDGPSSHQALLDKLQQDGKTHEQQEVHDFMFNPQLPPVLNSVPFNIDSEKRSIFIQYQGFGPGFNPDKVLNGILTPYVGTFSNSAFLNAVEAKVKTDLTLLSTGVNPGPFTGSLLTATNQAGMFRIDYYLAAEQVTLASGQSVNGLTVAAIVRAVDTTRLVPANMETIYDRTYRTVETYWPATYVDPSIRATFEQNFHTTFRFQA